MRNGNDMIMRDVKSVPMKIANQRVFIDGKYDRYDLIKAFFCFLGGVPMVGFSFYEVFTMPSNITGIDALVGGMLIGAAVHFFRRARRSQH